MTTATIDPPAPPAPPADPTACLTSKLRTLYNREDFSLRMITIVGSILKDEAFSVKAFEPIEVKGERVLSAKDDAFSLDQLDSTFKRIIPSLGLTEEERNIWKTKYQKWKTNDGS